MTSKFSRLSFLAISTLLFGTGCNTLYDNSELYEPYLKRDDSLPTSICGTISDNFYSAGNDLFSINIPIAAEKAYIDDYCEDGDAGVTFCNKRGYLLKIEALKMWDALFTTISQHPEEKSKELSKLFHEIFYLSIKERVSQPKILNEEFVNLEDGEVAYFVVLELPGYATVSSHGRAEFSHQGILIYFKNHFVIEAVTQDMYTLNFPSDDKIKEGLKDRLLQNLLKAIQSFQMQKTTP